MPADRLPPAARQLTRDTLAAVEATRSHDADGFDDACRRLAGARPEHVRLVLGAVVRTLLEQTHADGLTGDDVGLVLRDVVGASAWCPDVDPGVLLALLADALGVGPEGDEAPPPPPPLVVARHAALTVAVLTARSPVPLADHLRVALTEVHRAESFDA